MNGSINPKPRRGRPSRYKHSALARLRTIAGLTQREMSGLCGINFNTYRKAESEMNKGAEDACWIQYQNAKKISVATGACPDALCENKLKCLGTDRDYTRVDWQAYRLALIDNQFEIIEKAFPLIKTRLEAICDFADTAPGTSIALFYVKLALMIDRFQEMHEPILSDFLKKQPSLVSEIGDFMKNKVAQGMIKEAKNLDEEMGV